jgi:putative protease
MNNKSSKYELLAPAGDFSMLSAAVNAGADAVYLGLQEFSMRAAAKNFTIKDLDKINEICRKNKVKVYLTLNTIVYNNELKNLEDLIRKVKGKVDAIICWDFAVIELCKKHGIPFFISTQASVSNAEAARFYKNLGARRIILARELNLRQIKQISRVIDIECFVHGAMCVSVSGRCFTSQFLFNKSANRGECLHPCRRAYTVKDSEGNELRVVNDKIFSAKDLCTLPFIEEMKKAGVKAFKIEGRNRDARYVDSVVRIYRKALDKKLTKAELQESMKELGEIYNKGYSSGFYLKVPGSDDLSSIENNASNRKKHFVGKVIHYFPSSETAKIRLVSELKLGDEIAVIGNYTGFERTNISYMEKNKRPINRAYKGDEVDLKLPQVRKNDEVYLIKKIKK